MVECCQYQETASPDGIPYRWHEDGCQAIDRLLNKVRHQIITEQTQLAMGELGGYDRAAF